MASRTLASVAGVATASVPLLEACVLFGLAGRITAGQARVLARLCALLFGLAFLLIVAVPVQERQASAAVTLGRTLGAGWSLVSVPLIPADSTPGAVFSGISPLNLYSYTGANWAAPGEPGFRPIGPGNAYWLLLPSPATVQVGGDIASLTSEYHVPFSTGWNLFGPPWPAPIDWTDASVSFSSGGQTKTLSAAIASDWIAGPVFGYDPASGYSAVLPNANPQQQLLAWRGYHMFAKTSGEIIFSPPPADATPPLVSITSPAENADLSGLVQVVGTVDDASLASYEIQLCHVPCVAFTTVDSGFAAVTGGSLGAVDTTLLENGLYQIRIVATDLNGNQSAALREVLLSGDNKPGNFTISFVDMEVPVSGIPITIIRTYDSRRRGVKDDFGFGWNLEVVKSGTYLNNRKPGDGWEFKGQSFLGTTLPCLGGSNATASHITQIRFSDAEFYRFSLGIMNSGGLGITGACVGTASFTPIGGVPGASLQILGNTEVVWPHGDDNVYDFAGEEEVFGAVYEPANVRLTTIDGRKFDLNIQSGLNRIEEPNGNALNISAGGVSHSSGASLSFTRDGQGRITAITDPNGASRTYLYNAPGDLVTAKDRLNNATEHTYDAQHYLLTIKDPLGNVPLRNIYDATGRLVAQEDADGKRTEIDIDVPANKTTITNRLGVSTDLEYGAGGRISKSSSGVRSFTYTHDSRGNQLTETDALGNLRTFTYDANNLLTSERDATGNLTGYSYASGRLTTVTGPDGRQTGFSYDARGNVLSTADADGNTVAQYAYDTSGRMAQVNVAGGQTNFTYDSFGRATRLVTTGGQDQTFARDANGNVLSQTTSLLVGGVTVTRTTSFTYDAEGKVLTLTNPLGGLTVFTYDANGQKSSEKDPLNRTTSFQYDKRGNLTKITYPDGFFEAFGYDLRDRKTASTDRAGRTTFYDYNEFGNVTRVQYPGGAEMLNSYDAAGRLVSQTDPRSNVATFTYDAAGRLITATDPLGNAMTRAYDSNGRLVALADALGNTTAFTNDAASFLVSRPKATTFPGGATALQTFGANGRIASRTNELGQTTQFTYDAAGNLATVTNPLGGVTGYSYDPLGRLTGQLDALSRATDFEYDELGRRTKKTLPLGQSESYAYDAAGNMVSRTGFNGVNLTYTYDLMDRVTEAKQGAISLAAYTYTPAGQIATATDSAGAVTQYTYDARDRLTRVTNPGGSKVDYTYDANGNRTSVKLTVGLIPLTRTTTYAYDAANRLTSVTDPDAGNTAYTYDAAGRLTKTVYPNTLEDRRAYDSRDRLTRVQHTAAGGAPVLAQFDYVYNAASRRTQMTEAPAGRVVDYTYDALGRLLTETETIGVNVNTHVYTYDAVGNRVTRDRNGVVTSYTYDANDRLLTAGAETFGFNAKGQLTSRTPGGSPASFTYEYDALGRMVKHVAPDASETGYAYDAAGDLVSRTAGGSSESYLNDPRGTDGLSHILAALDSSGAISSEYTYGASLLRQRSGGTDSYYHADALGSVRALSDSAGTPTDTYAYDAYGNSTSGTGATVNPYGFAGERSDAASGLTFLRARWYQPPTGRFISTDPFEGLPGDPRTLHRYMYAADDPVNMADPTGEMFSLGSVSISLSISGILSALSIGFKIGNAIATGVDLFDQIKDIIEDWSSLKLNVALTTQQFAAANWWSALQMAGPTGNMGSGMVDEAFDVASRMADLTPDVLSVVYYFPVMQWMAGLPVVSDKPGHYLSCGFNQYGRMLFNLQTLTLPLKLVGGPYENARRAIGIYAYYTLLQAFMIDTLDGWADGYVPPQPASCW